MFLNHDPLLAERDEGRGVGQAEHRTPEHRA